MNKQRRRNDAQANQDAVQEGRVYLAYTQTINPATGKNWTIKEIAREVGEHYGYVPQPPRPREPGRVEEQAAKDVDRRRD